MVLTITGPSGSGKTSLLRALMKNYGVKTILSATTRPKRRHEKEGLDYHFIPAGGEPPLEAFFEYTEFGGSIYGKLREDVLKAVHDDFHTVYAIVVDREGAQKYAKAFPETVRSVYLDTLPEFAETNLIRRDGKAKARERIKSDAQAGLFSTKGYDCIPCNSEKMTIDGLAYQFMNYVEAMRRAFDMDHKEAV